MLDEVHYAAVLNFFYFLLLDEGSALSASYKTIRNVQKQLKKIPASPDRLLIENMSEVLQKYKKRKKQPAIQPPRSEWICTSMEFLGAWKEYMRHDDTGSAEVLVLRYILDYSVKAISEALHVPEGTIYFRLGRGLESFSKGSILKGQNKW